MIGQTIKTKKFGSLTITGYMTCGGEGHIYETNNDNFLLKVYDPRLHLDAPTTSNIIDYIDRKKIVYKTFANLKFSNVNGLRCLPLEDFILPFSYGSAPTIETASYIMYKASGISLTKFLESISIKPLDERLRVAQSLTLAVGQLHSRQVVHADLKPDNLFVAENSVYILDSDAGGYYGPHNSENLYNFTPTAYTEPIFRSPELINNKWHKFKSFSEARQPDLWAMAVLLYMIIVDYSDPFTSRPQRADLIQFGYKPYSKRVSALCDSWPQEWQLKLMDHIGLSSDLINTFKDVFSGEKDMLKSSKTRLLASDWSRRIQLALDLIQGDSISQIPLNDKLINNQPPSKPTIPVSVTPIIDAKPLPSQQDLDRAKNPVIHQTPIQSFSQSVILNPLPIMVLLSENTYKKQLSQIIQFLFIFLTALVSISLMLLFIYMVFNSI